MKKQLIRLTENDLHQIIKESVKNILMESPFFDNIEKELQLPYEYRLSRMTDEEIQGLLDKHKAEEMKYSQEQLDAEKERELSNLDKPEYNNNIEDDNFFRNEYVNYGQNVPM